MMKPLLTIPLRSRRDVVWARQRARRVAGLLQFESRDQALVAAGTFAIASQALEVFKHADLQIQIENRVLHVFAQSLEEVSSPHSRLRAEDFAPPNLMRLAKPLNRQQDYSAEDVRWLLSQLPLLEPFDVFEEMKQQNQEMLALLHATQVNEPQVQAARNPAAA